MRLASIPFPKSNRSAFLKAIAAISFTVILILTVLQPFGTARFQHDFKYVLLSGYGVTIFLSGAIYFIISDYILTEKAKDRWSIVYEAIFLFCNLIFSLFCCFLYWSFAFRGSFDSDQFLSFMLSAFSVALFPVAFYLSYMYIKYKEVTMTDFRSEQASSKANLTILGTNKSERIELDSDQLLFIESNNNYVILNILTDGEVHRKMIRSTLNNILGQLDDNFLKCHRSYIVNLNRITSLSGNITNSKLQLSASNTKIPVSRSRVDMLRSYLGK